MSKTGNVLVVDGALGSRLKISANSLRASIADLHSQPARGEAGGELAENSEHEPEARPGDGRQAPAPAEGTSDPRRRGITLVEVLVSLAMLGLAAVTVLQALARIAHAQALTSYQAHANLFAMAKLGGVEVAFREGREITPREAGNFRVGPHVFQWELISVPAKDAPPVRTVNLTVRWRAAQQDYSRTFETQLRLPTPGTP